MLLASTDSLRQTTPRTPFLKRTGVDNSSAAWSPPTLQKRR